MSVKTVKRNKPGFLRKDWHKKIKLGSTVKKKRKWRAAKGRHNKIRLNNVGHPVRPKIGWGSSNEIRGMVKGLVPVRVENMSELLKVEKGQGVIIGSVGRKKREELIKKASEMKLQILNKYKEKK
jgi:ribosomal protein L32E